MHPTSRLIPRWPACLWLGLGLLLPGALVHAGLLSEGTRVIYPTGAEGRTLLIANTNPWPVLVQTWVDQGEGDPQQADAPFVVLPAIFRLDPSATERLRIVHTGGKLADERESLFWLNLYEVPPSDTEDAEDAEDADADDEARLTLTLNTQLKILYRPEGVGAPDELPAQLQFRLERQDAGWCVYTWNPTPWHASISALSVDGADGPLAADEADLLLPPFTSRCYRLHDGQPGAEASVHFSLIGDEGFSEEHKRTLQQ